jgi:transketolase
MRQTSLEELQIISYEIRKDIIKMLNSAASGHPGGSLSCIDIITVLYKNFLRHDPKMADSPDRDRFILSKGHGVPALYGVLAEEGYIPKEELMTLRHIGSRLQGHPDKSRLPVLEASTGSLGQGLSIGIGMALACRLDKKDFHTYVLTGDGECQEGQIWEAVAYAGHHKVERLTLIVDENKFQLDAATREILSLDPMKRKLESFDWDVTVIDGHDFHQIVKALEQSRKPRKRPFAIVAQTVKGQGVSFMEENNDFHGVAPTDEETKRALKELDEKIGKIRQGCAG